MRPILLLAIPVLVLLAAVIVSSLAAPAAKAAGAVHYVTTIAPLGALVSELAGEDVTVTVLLPPGASPHSFAPRPSDASAASNATALIMIGPALDDWAARLQTTTRITALDLLPKDHARHADGSPCGLGHEHGDLDPHFWLDPLALAAIAPLLAELLAEHDPAAADTYRSNAQIFAAAMQTLHYELAAQSYVSGVVSAHRSFAYFLNRYGIADLGIVSPVPGAEPSPSHLRTLVARIKDHPDALVCTEPQLDPRPASVLAEAAAVRSITLDPLACATERGALATMIQRNAATLRATP